MELLSLDEKVETSVLYQNPYWPTVSNGVAIE
jgi:starch-binding outer membrane protein, SusD/RagB family